MVIAMTLVKHLEEFPEQPNLDRNEGKGYERRHERIKFISSNFYNYPIIEDSVKVILLNEEMPSSGEKIKEYLELNKYITNSEARKITGVVQMHKMSRLLRKWVSQGLLIKITHESKSAKLTSYKLTNNEDINN